MIGEIRAMSLLGMGFMLLGQEPQGPNLGKSSNITIVDKSVMYVHN